jgi:hypothetical protein
MKLDHTINYVLGMLLKEYLITARSLNVHIPEADIKSDMRGIFTTVLQKLELDEGILKLINAPHTETEGLNYAIYTAYEIKVYDNFLNYCETKGLYVPDNSQNPIQRTPHIITNDEEHCLITVDNSEPVSLFAPYSITAHLFAKVLKADGARLRADVLVNDYEDPTNPDKLIDTKALRNAKQRVNDSFYETFKLAELVQYKHGEFWLNLDYISSSSVYKSS